MKHTVIPEQSRAPPDDPPRTNSGTRTTGWRALLCSITFVPPSQCLLGTSRIPYQFRVSLFQVPRPAQFITWNKVLRSRWNRWNTTFLSHHYLPNHSYVLLHWHKLTNETFLRKTADSFWYTLYTYNLNCLKQSILCQKCSLYVKLYPRPEWKDKHTVRLCYISIPPHQQQLLHMKDSPYLWKAC